MRHAAALLTAVLGLATGTDARQARTGNARTDRGRPSVVADPTLWSILAPKQTDAAVDEGAVAKRIVRQGASSVRPAIAIFLGEIEEPDQDYEVDARIVDARPRILLAALSQLPRADVLVEVDQALSRHKDVDRRLALAQIASNLSGEEALRRVLDIASRLEPVQWERTFVQVPLQDDLARLVRGHDRLAMDVARRLRSSDPALARIFARSLADAAAWQTASEVALALGRDPRLDACVAETLTALAGTAPATLPSSVLAALRAQLESPDPIVVSAVAGALGQLGDESAARPLVQLLDDPDPVKQSGACSALATLSGRDLPAVRADWQAWLDQESAWLDKRFPELERTIGAADPVALPDAVAELAQHRLYRHRAALAILPMLGSDNLAVARLACSVLPTLGSRVVAPALRSLAQGGSSELQPAAASALRALTGENADAGANF